MNKKASIRMDTAHPKVCILLLPYHPLNLLAYIMYGTGLYQYLYEDVPQWQHYHTQHKRRCAESYTYPTSTEGMGAELRNSAPIPSVGVQHYSFSAPLPEE